MDISGILIIALTGAAVVLFAYAMFFAQFRLQVREIDLTFPNLPDAFDGYTILHLSDLHLTKLGLLEKILMRLIAQREVDTCLVTGDVTANPRASDIFRRVCSAIRHRDPLFMVLGNSEHKPWLDSEMLVNALTFDGLHMLINQSASIRRDGQKLVLVGVDDPYSRFADIGKAFEGVDSEDFIVFLTHCPSTTPQALDRGADLILAGHTHGGQVRFPGIKWFWTHMRANQVLNDGLYTSEDLSRVLRRDAGHAVLFVSRGVGTSRIHIRLMCPPEIAFITLRRG